MNAREKKPTKTAPPDGASDGELRATSARRGPLLRDRATSEIRRLVLDHQLKPGELLREEHLASLLGVSRGPVREAIVELEREGLAQRRAGRGSAVVELTQRDLEEVCSLRRAQEAVAIRFAIRAASDYELLELQRKVDTHAAACAVPESNEIRSQLDLDFHDYLYRIARHTRLYQTWLMIRMQVFMFLRMRETSGHTPELLERSVIGHRKIVEALIARDVTRALDAADEHLVQGYERSIASMPEWWLQSSSATLLPSPPVVGGPLDGRGPREARRS